MALVTSAAASLKNTWGFSPQSIPGLQLWMDAADTSTYVPSSAVTDWRNKGSAGGVLTSSTGTVSSIGTTINNLPVMSFPVAASMTVPSLTYTSTSKSVIIVVTVGGGGVVRNFFTPNSINLFPQLTEGVGNLKYTTESITIYQCPQASTINYHNATSILGGYNDLISGTFSGGIYVNGTIQPSSISAPQALATGTISTMTVGSPSSTASFVLGEILVYDAPLTTTEHQQVEGYLATKWGLKANLPATHPYSAATRIPFNRPFFPTDISGCSLWLDAADASTVTGRTSVTAWRDKSGSGIVMAGSSPPSYSGSGVNFAGSHFLSNASFPFNLSSRTIFIICSTGVTTGMVLDLGQDGTVDFNTINSLAIGGRGGANPNGIVLTENFPPINIGFNSATPRVMYTDTWSVRTLNVYNAGNLVSNVTATFTPTSSASVMIGARWNPNIGGFMTGTINEIILFSTALTTSQRQQVEQYLAWKWDMTTNLPVGHPGKVFPAFGTVAAPPSVSFLVVGGGGGGGSRFGGGGGAGGFLTGELKVSVSTSYTVTVGTGGTGGAGSGTAGTGGQNTLGAQTGGRGNSSVFSIITASGGGGGGAGDIGSGVSGASGGGSAGRAAAGADPYSGPTPGGTGIPGQGFAGAPSRAASYLGGGGGGAGGAAVSPSGGIGRTSSITGTAVIYAGGGGGGGSFDPSPTFGGAQNGEVGGLGGGGAGGPFSGGTATAGTANTGGGGGGGAYNSVTASFPNNNQPGANGGSGVVILAYPSTYNGLLSFIDASLTFTQNFTETNIVYRFTAGTGNVRW